MRVAIIGAGAAGSAAAFKLKLRGHDVSLFHAAPGATALSSGCVDLFGAQYFSSGQVEAAYHAFLADHPFHFFSQRKLKLQDMRASLLDWVRPLDSSGLHFVADFEVGLMFANTLGLPKWSVMAQKSFAQGDLRRLKGKRIGVVVLEGSSVVDFETFTSNMAWISARQIECVRINVPAAALPASPDLSFQIAMRLDRASHAQKLIGAIKDSLKTQVHAVALPPVLGLHEIENNLKNLEKALGVPCFELSAVHDSVPGMRLQHAIEKALLQFQIPIYKSKVESISTDAGGVEIDFNDEHEKSQQLIFDVVILASGHFIGGGLQMSEQGPIEPHLHLPVHTFPTILSAEREVKQVHASFPTALRLWGEGFFSEHNALSCGLSPDGQFELKQGVYAVGALMGGTDASREQGGLAAAVVTGSLLGSQLA